MSIIWENESGWILCHSLFLHNIYNSTSNEYPCILCQKYTIFHLSTPFLKLGQKYVPSNDYNSTNEVSCDISELGNYAKKSFKSNEAIVLKQLFMKLMNSSLSQKLKYFKKCPRSHENLEAMQSALEVLKQTMNTGEFEGGNTDGNPISVSLMEQNYLVPASCRFYNYDISKISGKLYGTYDLILLDPPWRNKHVRRKNVSSPHQGYRLMHTRDISELPISNLLTCNGLVAVWCTNSANQIQSLITEIFSSWGLEYISTWYWIKVTEEGQLICDFSNQNKKQPYERIIFGSKKGRQQNYKNPEPNKIIVSIPSAVHSHKPPLTSVLSKYIPTDSRCIEFFSRYLLPNWTSYGNEVLKLQHQLLFR